MDYVTPKEIAGIMLDTAVSKTQLSVKDLLIRGMLSGALLAISVTLAFTASVQTGLPLMGAIAFPVGFIIIVLLGLELVTGSFALIPLAFFEKKISARVLFKNLTVVFIGNLLGSVLYGFIYWAALSEFGTADSISAVDQMIIKAAEKKTVGYAVHGVAGFASAFLKAVLCNWMVCMGVVMGLTSKSTVGKIIAAGIPIFIFFSLGFEHSVVNMFVIPTGMLFNANVTLSDWWLYNQLIVTLGNLVGGLVFTGMAVYYTFYTPRRVELN